MYHRQYHYQVYYIIYLLFVYLEPSSITEWSVTLLSSTSLYFEWNTNEVILSYNISYINDISNNNNNNIEVINTIYNNITINNLTPCKCYIFSLISINDFEYSLPSYKYVCLYSIPYNVIINYIKYGEYNITWTIDDCYGINSNYNNEDILNYEIELYNETNSLINTYNNNNNNNIAL